MKVAGIDIHKKVLMVVVRLVQAARVEGKIERRRVGTTTPKLQQLAASLEARGVQEVVTESTAQYWKPVCWELEGKIPVLQLAQDFSNRARRGREHDIGNAERLVRWLVADELVLSFVPAPEQRNWRTLTRMQVQSGRDRVRLRNQGECLLEEMQIELSNVLSDLFGVTGRRILGAFAEGESNPRKLAGLADGYLKCTPQELLEALTGNPQLLHSPALKLLYLERLQLIDRQTVEIKGMVPQALEKHQEAVVRLAELLGFEADSAQQMIAEAGAEAATFPSAGNLAYWVGTWSGKTRARKRTTVAVRPTVSAMRDEC